MKKYYNLFIILVFLMSINLILANNNCNPSIEIVNQDPTPAIPNSYVKLVFEVSGLYNCDGFTVKLAPEYPFSLDPGYDTIQSISKTPSVVGGYKDTWNFAYKIRVADDALEGDYELKLFTTEGINTNLQSVSNIRSFNLSLIDSQTDFATVIQDSSGSQISLGIVNTGKNTANSLIVSIPTQENFRSSGTSEQIVGNLAAGDYTIVSFSISPKNSRNNSQNRQSGIENNPQNQILKIKMDYTDAIGKRRSVIKEIDYNANQGNSTAIFRNFSSQNRRDISSGISIWWYIISGIIIILIVLSFIYKKYKKKSHHLSTDNNSKISKNDPNWVSSVRTQHKK
jgi:hypothetical protein